MEFQQLEMFAAVVEESSVSRAAERVCRTAPAVSIALRKLEDEIGAPLFDRSERLNYQLTAAGKLLYSYATRILGIRTEALASVREITHRQRKILRLGTHESTSLYLLPALIHALNEVHPGIKTEVVCGSSERLLAALRSRAIQLVLIGDAPDEPDLERHLIRRDKLVVITSPEHRLTGLKRVHLSDLAGEFLIVQGAKSVLRDRIVRALQQSDVPFNLGVENVAIEAIKRMVAEGLGIGFVPLMCVREEVAGGKLLSMDVGGLRSEWNLSVVHRKDDSLSPAARSFVDLCRETADSIQETQTPLPDAQQRSPAPQTGRRRPFAIRPRKLIHC